MTEYFPQVVHHFFCPAVERYYTQNNLSTKTLLILDSAPGHPVNLSDLSDNMSMEYLLKKNDSIDSCVFLLFTNISSCYVISYITLCFPMISCVAVSFLLFPYVLPCSCVFPCAPHIFMFFVICSLLILMLPQVSLYFSRLHDIY